MFLPRAAANPQNVALSARFEVQEVGSGPAVLRPAEQHGLVQPQRNPHPALVEHEELELKSDLRLIRFCRTGRYERLQAIARGLVRRPQPDTAA